MVLRSLRLFSFRAHPETEVEFAPGVNLLYGPNGAGKTNILEAIHYLCLSKSFIAPRDTYALRQGSPYFEVEGRLEGERRSELRARIVYVPGEGKRMFINGAPLERLSDVVGMLPVVVFSPEDYQLTAGGPDERRRFVDNILCQAHAVYMDDLMKYRRARRQRNELLMQHKRRSTAPPDAALRPWTEELVALGSRIVARRQRFIRDFSAFLEEAYAHIEAAIERPSIEYESVGALPEEPSAEAAAEVLRDAFDRTARGEWQRGRTLVGPQRDEFVFRLGELEVRRYGSQGQHRTFGMALKLAQYLYLHDRLEEHPLLLLDDAFAKLDARRSRSFLGLVQSGVVGQSFVTATARAPFEEAVDFGASVNCALLIEAGAVASVAEER